MKNICFVTGTRAEYGLLSPLMKLFQDSQDFNLQVVVTGMHLSPEFGMTYEQIESDGFSIDEKVEVLLSSDSKVGLVKSTGLGLLSFPEVFERLKSDMIVLLGDRYETFSATIAGYFLNIPIAHLHGGETTEGAIDEGIRHSITKMSHLHFTSTEVHRNRVIQLGENPKNVYNVGAIGIDNILNLPLISRVRLEESLQISLDQPFFLITYHPVTISDISEEEQLNNLFTALDAFPDIVALFTLPNSDAGGRAIIKLINQYVGERDNAYAFTSLGQLRYLSAVKESIAVVGNSSSGIIEVPSLETPTVDIGIRQKGREAAESVIHSDIDMDSIKDSIKIAISKEFRNKCTHIKNPYGNGNCAQQIFKIITNEIGKITLQKPFNDIGFTL